VQTPILLSVKVRRKLDPDPDPPTPASERTTSPSGTSSPRRATTWANLPDDYPTPPRGREYRAFRPEAGGERPGSPRYQQYGLRDYTRMEALDRLRGPVRRSEGRHAERRPNRPTDEERMIRLVWATRVLDSNSPPGWATYREAWDTYRKVLDVPKR
jgi:hypothetical protein